MFHSKGTHAKYPPRYFRNLVAIFNAAQLTGNCYTVTQLTRVGSFYNSSDHSSIRGRTRVGFAVSGIRTRNIREHERGSVSPSTSLITPGLHDHCSISYPRIPIRDPYTHRRTHTRTYRDRAYCTDYYARV